MHNDMKAVLDQASDQRSRFGVWGIADHYVVRDGAVVGSGIIERYRPLEKYPDLFIRFARNGEAKGLPLAWAKRYGALGLSEGVGGYSIYGPDPITDFNRESRRAAILLRLYEAATDPGGVDTDSIREVVGSDFFQSPEQARKYALNTFAAYVQNRLFLYTCPALYALPNGQYANGYDFKNLLGAVYLQAFWLISSIDARRCKNPECNKPISPGPEPEGYESRSDKLYCSRRCRNRAGYLRRR